MKDRWEENSACNGMNTNLFYPESRASRIDIEKAVAVCQQCGVRKECLAAERPFGLSGIQGIRGGQTEQERRLVFRTQPLRQVAS